MTATSGGRTRRTTELPGSERAAGKDVGRKDISGPRGHRSTCGCDSQAGGMAPAEALTPLLRRVQLREQLKTSTGPLIPQASVFKAAEKMKGGATWG